MPVKKESKKNIIKVYKLDAGKEIISKKIGKDKKIVVHQLVSPGEVNKYLTDYEYQVFIKKYEKNKVSEKSAANADKEIDKKLEDPKFLKERHEMITSNYIGDMLPVQMNFNYGTDYDKDDYLKNLDEYDAELREKYKEDNKYKSYSTNDLLGKLKKDDKYGKFVAPHFPSKNIQILNYIMTGGCNCNYIMNNDKLVGGRENIEIGEDNSNSIVDQLLKFNNMIYEGLINESCPPFNNPEKTKSYKVGNKLYCLTEQEENMMMSNKNIRKNFPALCSVINKKKYNTLNQDIDAKIPVITDVRNKGGVKLRVKRGANNRYYINGDNLLDNDNKDLPYLNDLDKNLYGDYVEGEEDDEYIKVDCSQQSNEGDIVCPPDMKLITNHNNEGICVPRNKVYGQDLMNNADPVYYSGDRMNNVFKKYNIDKKRMENIMQIFAKNKNSFIDEMINSTQDSEIKRLGNHLRKVLGVHNEIGYKDFTMRLFEEAKNRKYVSPQDYFKYLV